jgi:hypothetical protein
MKIAFTICSNNYWAQARVLFQSLFDTNPDYKLILGLVDKKNDFINYSINDGIVEVIESGQIGISNEYNIWTKYDIIELNTSVKASYIKWIKQTYNNAEIILYFDPDIKVFSTLSEIESNLKEKSIVLTPHIYKPIPIDCLSPNESLFLNYGIYNLGFIGISFIHEQVFDFLDWWEERLMKQCFINISKGIFVDQLPINLVPIFFPKITKIIFNYGMNVAPWNLHERRISFKENEYYVNENKLIFFHFSNIQFKTGKHLIYNRYKLYPTLENLYNQYKQELIKNGFFELKHLNCFYKTKPIKKNILKRIINKLLNYHTI